MTNLRMAGIIFCLWPLWAFSQDGTLDSTFGDHGTIVFPNFYSQGGQVFPALDIQGRTLIVTTLAQDSILVVHRYLPDGQPDPVFGEEGQVQFSPGAYGLPEGYVKLNHPVFQADGKMLIGMGIYQSELNNKSSLVLRLKENGSLDSAFSDQGFLLIESVDPLYIDGIGLQTDGQIVISGNIYRSVGWGATDVVLLRLTTDGKVDSTMGVMGQVITDLTATGRDIDYGGPLTVQNDGKIVVAACNGAFWTGQGPLALMRHLPDGTLDSSFGINGIFIDSIRFDIGQVSTAITFDKDSNLLVAGSDGMTFGGGPFLTLRRFTPEGRPDTTFADNGWYISVPLGWVGSLEDVVVQPDQKILLAGGWTGNNRAGVLMRFTAQGQLDTTFGNLGMADYSLEDRFLRGLRLYQYPEGKISLLGFTQRPADGSFQVFLARFLHGPYTDIPEMQKHRTIPMTVFPNPSGQSSLTLTYVLNKPGRISARLFDPAGRIISILIHSQEKPAGLQTDRINLPKGLPAGMYVIQISRGSEENGHAVFLKL